jgi:hypothetical protein
MVAGGSACTTFAGQTVVSSGVDRSAAVTLVLDEQVHKVQSNKWNKQPKQN